jgi:hypothetical protein
VKVTQELISFDIIKKMDESTDSGSEIEELNELIKQEKQIQEELEAQLIEEPGSLIKRLKEESRQVPI